MPLSFPFIRCEDDSATQILSGFWEGLGYPLALSGALAISPVTEHTSEEHETVGFSLCLSCLLHVQTMNLLSLPLHDEMMLSFICGFNVYLDEK